MGEGDILKNLFKFYLDPDLLSEEEARGELEKEQVKVKEIEKRMKNFELRIMNDKKQRQVTK